MEEDAMGSDALALNYSQREAAGSVDLVGRLKSLSSGRKKLMTKYFDLEEVESGPLLAEYFAVSLAFVALGAMIREANVRMRRREGDGADGVSPKLHRMALDSMLKSAMERLRALAHRTQTLEDKVRDRSYMEAAFQFERLEFLKRISGLEAAVARYEEAEGAWRREREDLVKRIGDVDAQRGYFFKKMAEAEGSLADMQRLRMEDGKANAKLVEIYAGREQSWKSERVKMRHEIELLKEKLSKLQPQMKSPRSFDAAADALRMRNLKRRAKEMAREKVFSEREFAPLIAVDTSPKSDVDSRPSKGPSVPADERKDAEGDVPDLSAAQNQEMEAELAIILKRVGALKRRGSSGGKLDGLLNEARDKPKLKRFGSFDQAPRGIVVDDTFLSDINDLKDVEMDKEDAKDIWQAIEVQEGRSVQRRNGVVDDVGVTIGFVGSPKSLRDCNASQRPPEGLVVAEYDRALPPMSVLDSAEKPKPYTPEKSSSPRTPDWLTVVENDRDLESDAADFTSEPRIITEEPLNPDGDGWDGFFQEKPSSPKNIVNERDSWEEVIEEKPSTPESNVSECDGWEEFIQEKLDSLEHNISERTPEGSPDVDNDRASEDVAIDSEVTSDQTVDFEEGGGVGSAENKNGWNQDSEGNSSSCAEPASHARDSVGHGRDDLILLEDDIKSEIIVDSGELEEARRPLASGTQGQAEAPAQDINLMSAVSGNLGEIPDVSSAHGSAEPSVVDCVELPEDVIKSEIVVSDPLPTSPTLDSDPIVTNDLKEELLRADTTEGEVDDISDIGQLSTVPGDGQVEVADDDPNNSAAEDDLNNSAQVLSPGRTSPQPSPGRTITTDLESKDQESYSSD